ncbi:hypothetical protein ACVWZ5_000203 [Pseudomonas sp. TE6283]
MAEVVDLNRTAATAALQVVIELIRAGQLKSGIAGREADSIIATHQKLTEHFEQVKGMPVGSSSLTR